MGGTNETMKEFVEYKPEAGTTPSAGYTATEKVYKQGMSGSPNQSPERLLGQAQSLYGDLRSKASQLISPNLFGRDVSAPASADNTKNK